MTDAVIENHLLGKETVGVYPLLPDRRSDSLATTTAGFPAGTAAPEDALPPRPIHNRMMPGK